VGWNPFKKKTNDTPNPAETTEDRQPIGVATPPPEPASPKPAAAATPPAAAEAPPGDAVRPASPAGKRTPAEIHHDVVEVLKTVFDPEIPVNIYELGLVYDIDVKPNLDTAIQMTLTSPMCPVAGSLPPEVETKVRGVPGIGQVIVDLVWDPPWTPEKMTEASRLQLGLM